MMLFYFIVLEKIIYIYFMYLIFLGDFMLESVNIYFILLKIIS